MTIQDLKDNREQIINIIVEMVGEGAEKVVMADMVATLGWNGIKSTNAVDYTIEIINLNDHAAKWLSRNDAGCFGRIEATNREMSQRQMNNLR